MRANTAAFYFEVIGHPTEFRVTECLVIEAVSSLYDIEVTVACEDAALELSDVIGKPGVLTILDDHLDIEHPDNNIPNRCFHGEIIATSQQSSGHQYTLYQFKLAPKLWFLNQRSGCRIFQDISTIDLITTLLDEANITSHHYRIDTKHTYTKRAYCVQYHETEFQFLSRLMEEEGIFYFFEHHLDRHVLVIADQNQSFKTITGTSRLPYHPKATMNASHRTIYELRAEEKLVPNQTLLADYNFKKPKLKLVELVNHAGSDLSHYHYPGNFDTPAQGKLKARVRVDAYGYDKTSIHCKTDCRQIAAGYRFSLSHYDNNRFNGDYLILQTVIAGKQPQSLEAGANASGTGFVLDFSAIPSSTSFKAPVSHTKPMLEGIQTAFVVGPSNEEIYVDQYGRIKVQFHWDRQGRYNENASCWLRVSQANAGNQWGAIAIPRVGQEVIVSFVNGDIDRPLVTGGLYHGVNTHPYPTPEHKTRLTLKTRSYPGGNGYNEIRMDDKKGSEQIYVHAQKDFDTYVKNDFKTLIEHERHETIKGSVFTEIKGDNHESIGSDKNLKIAKKASLQTGKDVQQKIGGSAYMQANQDVNQKAGNSIVLQAGAKISLKGGSGYITIDPSGIAIGGPLVRINSGGSASSAKSASPKTPKKPTLVSNEKPKAAS
ncbi:MAG: type VI secretion system tip protein VgrG [Pseudomonadales bacterium]|nr:type VI secretion system tip protein VgrG [Pseudomonadales bacterium]